MPIEDKQKLLEYNRSWFNNQSPERQLELREKARKYDKDRYNNTMVEVAVISIDHPQNKTIHTQMN